MRFSVKCAFPHLGKRGAASRKSAFCNLRLTEKRSLGVSPSRKSAVCAGDAGYVTKRRILDGRRHGKAHFTCGPHQKAHSACDRSRRVRLSVRVHAQNALFRRVRFSSPGQTRRLLTEKRILQPASHGKPHSATVVLPKSALCDTPLEVRSHGVRLSVRNGDTHPRHTRRLLTSQTHKAGHPSPHCHLILNVPVLHVHHRVAV